MKIATRIAFGLALLAVAALPASAGSSGAEEWLEDVPAIRLEQSAELGIPLCPPGSLADPGYSSAEELAEAIEAAGDEECVSRSEVVFATDRPTPSIDEHR